MLKGVYADAFSVTIVKTPPDVVVTLKVVGLRRKRWTMTQGLAKQLVSRVAALSHRRAIRLGL